MAFNNLMHPRNLYCKPPDFKALAQNYPEFAKCVIKKNGKIHPDFKDPQVLRSLTVSLLKKDFDLTVEIPSNCLIPTIPQRLNYILWLEDLLSKANMNKDVKGIDIGTGPCCIFSLLGAKKNEWQFVATEVVEHSFQCAKRNVLCNNLQEKITVEKVNEGMLLKHLVGESDRYHFCMCNPPFFGNQEQLHRRKKLRLDVIEKEVIVEGGEVEFVKKMIEESLDLKDRIGIYSSMVGRKCSMEKLQKILKTVKDIKFTVTEFGQGNTVRWGVAWTFLKIPDFKVAYSKKQNTKPHFSFVVMEKDNLHSVKEIVDKIITILNEFQIIYVILDMTDSSACLKVTAHENTWSHQRRKRREKLRKERAVASTFIDDRASGSNASETCSILSLVGSTAEGPDKPTRKHKHDCNKFDNCAVPVSRKEEMNQDDQSITSSQYIEKTGGKDCLLDCNINVEKQKDDIFFHFSCSDTSDRQTMHQVYFLIKERMSK